MAEWKNRGVTTMQLGLRKQLESALNPERFGVERILAHRIVNGMTEYLVQWEGCSYLQCTYEKEDNLSHAQRKLAAYQAKRRQIEIDASLVLCEDPLRTGSIAALRMRRME